MGTSPQRNSFAIVCFMCCAKFLIHQSSTAVFFLSWIEAGVEIAKFASKFQKDLGLVFWLKSPNFCGATYESPIYRECQSSFLWNKGGPVFPSSHSCVSQVFFLPQNLFQNLHTLQRLHMPIISPAKLPGFLVPFTPPSQEAAISVIIKKTVSVPGAHQPVSVHTVSCGVGNKSPTPWSLTHPPCPLSHLSPGSAVFHQWQRCTPG